MSDPPPPNGLVVLDKPAGWTSHDVVAKSRGVLGTRKVGHSGTLDPMATGVLVLGVGRSTKLLTFLSGLPKTYSATIRFGVETDSLDADGDVTVTHEMPPPDPRAVQAAAAELTGEIMQVPPMVSAIKVDGKRLHQLAREGKEVHRDPRPVHVGRFDVSPGADPMTWTAEIECSSGTYVRVLAADLGHALGAGAHLVALRRRSVGPFTEAEAAPIDEPAVMAPSELARVLETAVVDSAIRTAVGHGKVLERSELGVDDDGEGPWAVLDADGALVAVYVAHGGGRVKPATVLVG